MQNNYTTWAVENGWGFELHDGEFKGTVIQIEDVNFIEEDSEDGNMELKFHILSTPDNMSKEELAGDSFTRVISECMNDILTKAIENYKESE